MRAELVTPVRGLGRRTDESWVALRDTESTYLDGAEAWLYETMLTSSDLSSTSTEMVLKARDWAERYHTDPARSNVLRPFDIPADARVLEVGAGCGAVTRYLGERAALVDAVEPVPARARVARARTRDLDNVEVFVGLTADVPAVPTYDLVVVVGVLEYVGAGTADPAPYEAFLAELAERMLPTATLVLAIENKLGVKYLAGAPEDHTGRLFDSLESYPSGGIARTFSRRELEGLLTRTGFTVETKVAFPDYKLTRTVLDVERLETSAAALAHRVPRFPSHDWYVQRPKIVHEGLLWRSMVEAGIGADVGNSLVAVARRPEASSPWASDLLGAYYSVGRREDHLVETRIVATEDGATTVRGLLRGDGTGRHGDLEFVGGGVHDVRAGEDLVDHVGGSTDDELTRLLAAWAALLEERAEEPVLLDLIPQNLLVAADGSLVVIDQEWVDHGATWSQVRRRGLLRLGMELAERTPPDRWPGLETVRDVVDRVAALAGTGEADWLEQTLDDEAVLQRQIACPPYAGASGDSVEWWRSQLDAQLERRLADLPLGIRQPEVQREVEQSLRQSVADLDQVRAELESFQEQTRVLTARAAELDAWIAAHQAAASAPSAAEQELRGALDRAATMIEKTALELDAEKRRADEAQTQLTAVLASRTWAVGRRVVGAARRVQASVPGRGRTWGTRAGGPQ